MRSMVLNDGLAIVAGRDGYFLINRKDFYIGQALEMYGEYGGIESTFLKRMLKPGDTAIEVGANIGSHTIGLAKAVEPGGKIYAFEPQRACYALLQTQIALNQLSNVFAFNEGVGRTREQLFVPYINYNEFGNFGGLSLTKEQAPAMEAVDVVTIDERLGDVPCALIKIDVEGMEEDVIQGGLNLIRKHSPILYVENDRIEKSKSLISLIMAQGYRLWWHIPSLYNPDNYFKMPKNFFGNVASFNMICMREPSAVISGLQEISSPDEPHPLSR